jgi:hypothetical protein
MREQLETLMINSFMSYKQLERILEESEKIPARDMQTLKNLQKEFFKIINTFVQAIPETKNEDKKENKNNEEKNELIV